MLEKAKDSMPETFTVNAKDLKELHRMAGKVFSDRGILGFNPEGVAIVNDIGMVTIIEDVVKEDVGALGTIKSIKVSRELPHTKWNTAITFKTTKEDYVLNLVYTLEFLQGKRKFEYEPI